MESRFAAASAPSSPLSPAADRLSTTTRPEPADRLCAAHAVATALSDAATLEAACTPILRAIGECMGWDVGGLWTLDADSSRLLCVDMWRAEGSPGASFVELSRRTSFPRGVGLPGRVWATGAPAWVRDVARDENFPRAATAAADGLHGAFAVPLTTGERFLGVIEFFHRSVREPDEETLRFFATVGSQIGQFVRRSRLEEALRADEERTRKILENALDAFVSMDSQGRVTAWNRRAEESFGWPADQVLGRPLADVIIPPEHREAHRAGLARFLSGSPGPLLDRRVETNALHRDGSRFPVELWITAVRVQKAWTFHAFLRDIRERRETEETLRRSEDASRRRAEAFRCLLSATAVASAVLYERLAAALGDALSARFVVLAELEGGTSRRVRSMAVWSEGQRGDPVEVGLEGTPWEVLTKGTSFRRAGPSTWFPWDETGSMKGAMSWIGTPIRTATGRLLGFVAVLHDAPIDDAVDPVTMVEIFAARIAAEIERRQNEATLRDSRERFRMLVEEIPNHCLVTLDLMGRIASWNPGAERMHGYRSEQALGQDVGFLSGEGLTQRKLELTAEHGTFYYESWANRADGTTFPVEITLSALRDERGRLYGYARVAREIAADDPLAARPSDPRPPPTVE